jgi:hypothetical protein
MIIHSRAFFRSFAGAIRRAVKSLKIDAPPRQTFLDAPLVVRESTVRRVD